MAKTQPRANRVLDFSHNNVHRSIEEHSPFRPKKTLRRSMGQPRPDPFAIPGEVRNAEAEAEAEETQAQLGAQLGAVSEEEDENVQEVLANTVQPLDDGLVLLEDDVDYPEPQQDSGVGIEDASAEPEHQSPPKPKRKPGRPRKSGASVDNSIVQHSSPPADATQSRKRDRASVEQEDVTGDVSISQLSTQNADPAQKRKRGRPPKNDKIIVHQEDHSETIDPSLLAHGDEYVVDLAQDIDQAEHTGQTNVELQPKSKGRKGKTPKERDPNRAMRATTTPVELNDGPSRSSKSPSKRAESRGVSTGPSNNMHLRATTPFEDSQGRQSRFGRNIIGPLKFWANEARIWKHGEVEGIVRAEEVAKPSRKKPKKKGKKAKKGIPKLDDIDEESETESVMADEWEQDVGVIAGTVANWDPEQQTGNPDDPIKEGMHHPENE